MLKGSKIGIVGGSGYLGSRLACVLAPHNQVVIIDRTPPFPDGKNKNATFIQCDILSPEAVLHATRGLDFLFHRAGFYGNLNSMQSPQEYYQLNVVGTLNTLRAAVQNKIRKFIFDSTEAVYGQTVTSPVTENQFPTPGSIYGATKLICENAVRMYDLQYGLPTLIFRYSRVRDAAKNDAILTLTQRALKGESVVLYNEGKPVIDFVDISDVIAANILGVESDIRNEVFNIGAGEGISFSEMFRTIQEFVERKDSQVSYKHLEHYPPISEFLFGPEIFYMSVAKAKKILGWEPKVSIRSSIRETVNFVKERS